MKALPAPPVSGSPDRLRLASRRLWRTRDRGRGAFLHLLPRYRTLSGRQRRFTIGEFSVSGDGWTTVAARGEAERLRVVVRGGGDPLRNLQDQREAPTVADLARRFEEEHLPKRRAHTADGHKRAIRLQHPLPTLKHRVVADLTHTDIADLHRKVTKNRHALRRQPQRERSFPRCCPSRSNGGGALDNPAKGVERNPEEARHRYLSPAELAKLTEALASVQDQQGANVIRLLVLDRRASGRGVRNALGSTGPRRGGVDQAAVLHQAKADAPCAPLERPRANSSLLFAEGREAEAKTSREEVSPFVFPGDDQRERS